MLLIGHKVTLFSHRERLHFTVSLSLPEMKLCVVLATLDVLFICMSSDILLMLASYHTGHAAQ